MKKVFWIISVAILLTGGIGCIKETGCQPKSVASEEGAILSFAANSSIAGTTHSSGVYYQVVSPGSGATPSATSKIFVTYTGKLLNGTVFDSGTTPAGGWVLSGLIPGWQIGLPLIQKGGVIKLIIPSSLAYGCQDTGPIPGNSILYFEITLNDVQ
ncbi:MAG: FKBP-type peptidyl-prolyl cis-trans isomerase [Chitinophagaceae bacterium]